MMAPAQVKPEHRHPMQKQRLWAETEGNIKMEAGEANNRNTPGKQNSRENAMT
jgi:D-lyxose ketol-isomerase